MKEFLRGMGGRLPALYREPWAASCTGILWDAPQEVAL